MELTRELERSNIVGLAESRWPGFGETATKVTSSGTEERRHQHGVGFFVLKEAGYIEYTHFWRTISIRISFSGGPHSVTIVQATLQLPRGRRSGGILRSAG